MEMDVVSPDSVALGARSDAMACALRYSATMLACSKADRWVRASTLRCSVGAEDLSLHLLSRAIQCPAAPDDAISVLSAGLGAHAAARQWQAALQRLAEIEQLVPSAKARRPCRALAAQEKHWLQEAQLTAMFAAQCLAWAQCLWLLRGTELTGLGCAIRACGTGRRGAWPRGS